jgi:hypothetical protein
MLLLVEFLLVVRGTSLARGLLEDGLDCLGGVPPPTTLAKRISVEVVEGRVPSSLRDSAEINTRFSIIYC